jgi:hypothetical protein
MISNWKVVNNKVIELIEIYNSGFGHFFILVRLGNSKFECQNMINFLKKLGKQMIPNEKVINCKVIELNEMYKFCFGHFSIPLYSNNSKFKF